MVFTRHDHVYARSCPIVSNGTCAPAPDDGNLVGASTNTPVRVVCGTAGAFRDDPPGNGTAASWVVAMESCEGTHIIQARTCVCARARACAVDVTAAPLLPSRTRYGSAYPPKLALSDHRLCHVCACGCVCVRLCTCTCAFEGCHHWGYCRFVANTTTLTMEYVGFIGIDNATHAPPVVVDRFSLHTPPASPLV